MKAEKWGLSPRPTTSSTHAHSLAQRYGPALQEKGRRWWIAHKPGSWIIMTRKCNVGEDGILEFEGKMTVHFSLLPGAKQSQWFPIKEPKLGSFLTQFTPLPVQRGANCTSWSCLPRRVYLNGGQALFAQLPFEQLLSWKAAFIQGQSSTPAPQRDALDHSGPRGIATTPVFAMMGTCQAHSTCSTRDSQPFPPGKQAREERHWAPEEAGII